MIRENVDLVDYEEEERKDMPLEDEYIEDEELVEEESELGEKVGMKGSYAGSSGSGFQDFMLKPELLQAVTVNCGFEHPSEVQQQCIPEAIMGVDVLCQAKSGMGKTAIFVLVTLQQLDMSQEDVSVLVLCHTRELAYQIKREYDRFSKYMPWATSCVVYGGINIQKQIKEIKTTKPKIVVGTIGRILDLAQRNAIDLSKLRHFVLDECDKLLDELNARRSVQKIFESTAKNKQVMMFTATLTNEIRDLCKRFMHRPHEVLVDDETKLTLYGLLQRYICLKEEEKNAMLLNIIEEIEYNQLVIFVKSPIRATMLSKILNKLDYNTKCVHSNMPQDKRLRNFEDFKESRSRIMVSTDIMGRGIDIERVNVVVNYDMASGPASYLHRVGRAGRFGTKGIAISFITTEMDNIILNQIQGRFEVSIPEIKQISELMDIAKEADGEQEGPDM